MADEPKQIVSLIDKAIDRLESASKYKPSRYAQVPEYDAAALDALIGIGYATLATALIEASKAQYEPAVCAFEHVIGQRCEHCGAG